MRRILLCLLLVAGMGVGSPRARAFTLLGEVPAWFTDNAGLIPPSDVYGPMNLGEEYRWAIPTINYAFDESFLNYFGLRGVEEVDKAIKVLNDLPSMSTINVNAYPTHSLRMNYRARDLGLYDLKTWVLKALLEQLGLGTPGRYVFTLRGREASSDPPFTNYAVIMRNFDPETWNPSAYINGNLWTYNSIYDNQDSPTVKASTVTEPVDPLVLAEPLASLIPGFSASVYGLGSFATGLTRDDVGGLRYLYRPDNRNVETLPTDATGSAGFGGAIGGSGEWTPVAPPSTNGAAGGGTTTNVVPFYPQAMRGGVDKVTFLRGPAVYQPGAYSVTNRYSETVVAVVTNGVQRTISQRVTRVLTAPDILFVAADLVLTDTSFTRADRTEVATSNDAINGNSTLDGPGQFAGPSTLTLNKVGPLVINTRPSFIFQPAYQNTFLWGSFDGTTNDPIVYPSGSSIRDLERAVFGGR